MAYSNSTESLEHMLLQFMSEHPMMSMLEWLCEQLIGGVPAKLTPPAIRKCQGYNKVKYFQNAYPRPVLMGVK